jgi:hypothetical protein
MVGRSSVFHKTILIDVLRNTMFANVVSFGLIRSWTSKPEKFGKFNGSGNSQSDEEGARVNSGPG